MGDLNPDAREAYNVCLVCDGCFLLPGKTLPVGRNAVREVRRGMLVSLPGMKGSAAEGNGTFHGTGTCNVPRETEIEVSSRGSRKAN